MSINISVSGSTLKECHEQILVLAAELTDNAKEEVQKIYKNETQAEPFATAETVRVFNQSQEAIASTREKITLPSAPQFPIAENNDVDSRGIPYDTRIHSSNREITTSGVWRRRRGVEADYVAQVEAELNGKAPVKKVEPFGNMTPAQYEQHIAPPKVTVPTTEVVAKLPEMPGVLAEAHIPATPAPSFAPPMQQAVPPNTYNAETFRANLLTILNDLATQGKINHDWIVAQKPAFGDKDVVQWNENQAACAGLFEAFVSWGFINRL